MTLRPLRPSDIPILEARAAAKGYPYPDFDDTEVVLVVESDGEIITACAAKRIVELYLWPMNCPPLTTAQAIQLLHSEMTKLLIELGYRDVEAFLPPPIAEKFGRRLERTWGWMKNWPSWTRHL